MLLLILCLEQLVNPVTTLSKLNQFYEIRQMIVCINFQTELLKQVT